MFSVKPWNHIGMRDIFPVDGIPWMIFDRLDDLFGRLCWRFMRLFKVDGPVWNFLEKRSVYHEYWYHTCLRQKETGLPVIVWLDDAQTYKAKRVPRYVKFQGDTDAVPKPDFSFYIWISPDEPVVSRKLFARHKLTVKELHAVKEFVKTNHDALMKLSNLEIDNFDFIDVLIKCKS